MLISRMSPSPTGTTGLHLGSLRTMLTSYIMAKKNGGRFVFRIEDTDAVRSLEATEKKIMDALDWFGVVPDGEVVRQSDNAKAGVYQDIANKLLDNGWAYYCQCTTNDLKAVKAYQMRTGGRVGYPSTCRGKGHDDGVLRLNVRQIAKDLGISKIQIHDHILGDHRVDYRDVADVVLLRSDGTPTYILANTVDDCLAGVNFISRGSDLYPQTATQLVIYQAIQRVLGMKHEIPQYAHLPLITDAKKAKLSKRDPNTKGVLDYRTLGYFPEAVAQFALSLGNSSITIHEPLSMEQMIERFDIGQSTSRNTAYLDHGLDYVNRQHLRAKSADELRPLLKTEASDKLIDLYKMRVDTVGELDEQLSFLLRVVAEHPQDVQRLKQENFSAIVCRKFRDEALGGAETPPLDLLLEAV